MLDPTKAACDYCADDIGDRSYVHYIPAGVIRHMDPCEALFQRRRAERLETEAAELQRRLNASRITQRDLNRRYQKAESRVRKRLKREEGDTWERVYNRCTDKIHAELDALGVPCSELEPEGPLHDGWVARLRGYLKDLRDDDAIAVHVKRWKFAAKREAANAAGWRKQARDLQAELRRRQKKDFLLEPGSDTARRITAAQERADAAEARTRAMSKALDVIGFRISAWVAMAEDRDDEELRQGCLKLLHWIDEAHAGRVPDPEAKEKGPTQ